MLDRGANLDQIRLRRPEDEHEKGHTNAAEQHKGAGWTVATHFHQTLAQHVNVAAMGYPARRLFKTTERHKGRKAA
jgi:hypothetical protein